MKIHYIIFTFAWITLLNANQLKEIVNAAKWGFLQGIPDGFVVTYLAIQYAPVCDPFVYIPRSTSLLITGAAIQAGNQALNNCMHMSALFSNNPTDLHSECVRTTQRGYKKSCMSNWQMVATSMIIGAIVGSKKETPFCVGDALTIASRIYITHKVVHKVGLIVRNWRNAKSFTN